MKICANESAGRVKKTSLEFILESLIRGRESFDFWTRKCGHKDEAEVIVYIFTQATCGLKLTVVCVKLTHFSSSSNQKKSQWDPKVTLAVSLNHTSDKVEDEVEAVLETSEQKTCTVLTINTSTSADGSAAITSIT